MKKFLCFLLFALCLTVAANAQQFLAFDFENGNILTTVFTNDETYPWIVIDTTDDDGNAVRCIMSGNKGVASSTSSIKVTYTFERAGHISFDALCMGEGSSTAWDKCMFFIDDEVQFSYGAWVTGWHNYYYYVTAGEHTFTWKYSKDSSVNPEGDAFYVDNIEYGEGCVISEINIEGFTAPEWGAHPDYDMNVPANAGYILDYTYWVWRDNANDYGILPESETFNNENYVYHLYFEVWPKTGCSFADNAVFKVNGDANIIVHSDLDDEYDYYSASTQDYSVTEPTTEPCVISEINIEGFTAPEWGANPDYEVDVPEDATYTLDFAVWNWWDYNINDGDHLSISETFDNEDYVYYMYFKVLPNEGCNFADNMVFKVNGDANIIDIGDLVDEYGYYYAFTTEYSVTEPTTEPCVISEINIEGFTAPEWGANPDYTVDVPADANYTVNYTDWNWWSENLDNGDILLASESFDNEEYTYYMYFEILPNEGCSFADNVTFTVNGEAEDNVIETSGLSDNGYYWAYTYDYTVTEPTTEPCVISEINIEGFTAPEWGANPDYDVYVEDTRYTLDYADWNWWSEYLDNGDILLASESFDNEDYVYHMYFEVLPIDGCSFADNVVFKVNGNANIIENSGISGSFNSYWAYTIDYSVTAPTTNPCAAPTNLTATNITTNDATLGWTDNNGISTYFEVESYDESEGAWSLYGYGSDLNNPFSFSYYDYPLISGTTYRYRVQSRCSDGNWSDFSEYCYFTTMGGYCDAEVPSNLTTSDITAHSATVEWTENPDNYYNVKYIRINLFEDFENGLPADWTTIDYNGDGYDWYYFETNERAHSGTGVATSESYINGYGALTPDNWLITPQIDLNGTMRVWLRGQDPSWASEHFAIYLSTTGNTVADFTIPLVPEAVATGEYVEYIADLSAYAGQQGYIAIRHFNCTDMYRLNVDDFGVFLDDDWTTETVTGNSIELTGLEQGSHYLVQVQSVCDGDATSLSNSSLWSTVEFTTTEETEEPCETPTGLTASNITATTAKLEWTGSQDQYTVRYKEDAASDWTEATTTNRFFPLTGLTPETTYTAQVQGDCGTGAKVVTDWSEPVTFTTLSGTVEPGECGPAVDCEGTSYPTVKIGDLCWMQKNLAAESCVTSGNVYAYVNDQFPDKDANVATYGLLYDEEAAMQGIGSGAKAEAAATGICPEGWRLPTVAEIEALGAAYTADELKSTNYWIPGGGGTDAAGLGWLPGGCYNDNAGRYESMLLEGYLWATEEVNGETQPAMYKITYYCSTILMRVENYQGLSASVRCVKAPFTCGDNLIIGENSYPTVQIGTQCWTKTNLREAVGTNGTDLTSDNYSNTEPFYYVKPGVDAAVYGYYYNWPAANQVCPEGWHLPDTTEWNTMQVYVSTAKDAEGNYMYRCGGDSTYIAQALATDGDYWYRGGVSESYPCEPEYDLTKNNKTGFSAVPAGYWNFGFGFAGYYAYFWSSTEAGTDNAWGRSLYYTNEYVGRYYDSRRYGFSVRCVRD